MSISELYTSPVNKTADWPVLPDEEVVPLRRPDVEHAGWGALEALLDPIPSLVLFRAHMQQRDTDNGKTKDAYVEKNNADLVAFGSY